MHEIESTAAMLQKYGGWGLAAILIFAIVWLVKYVVSLHKENGVIRDKFEKDVAALAEDHAHELEKVRRETITKDYALNERMFSHLEKRTEQDAKYEMAFNSLNRTLERLIDRMP